jgi:AraC family transcriptional regulator of adaptative response/methylated-DNA-[protein]-cysteine methyltransferase
VLIPCHRVVRSDGGLAGYRWGIHRKRAMLEKEQKTAPAPDSLFFAATHPQN